MTDVFFDGDEIHLLPGERHPDGAAHGSGCTHSSALAAHLALGFTPAGSGPGGARGSPREAVRDGHREIGRGRGARQRAGRRRPRPTPGEPARPA